MAKPRRTLWYAVDVDARQNEKVVELPNDTARYGWFLAVLAEAKRQRRQGQFRSRAHLAELVGRFARFIGNYRDAGLLEEAPKLCPRCKRDFDDVPRGALVVHDWWQKQRDPTRAERAEAWRRERSPNDDQTPIERDKNEAADPTTSVQSGASPPRARDVRADDRESRVESQQDSLQETPYPDRAKTALHGAGYKRVTAKQLAMLAEIANREGWPQVLGWIATRPAGVDPIAHVKSSSNGERAHRLRRSVEREQLHDATKGTAPGLIAGAVAELIGSATANGASHVDRDAAIEQLRALRGQVPAEHWATLLERHHVSEEDLEDPVDFTAPQEAPADA